VSKVVVSSRVFAVPEKSLVLVFPVKEELLNRRLHLYIVLSYVSEKYLHALGN